MGMGGIRKGRETSCIKTMMDDNRVEEEKKYYKGFHRNAVVVVVLDILFLNASFFLAYLLRFDFRWSQIPKQYIEIWARYAPWDTVITILIYYIFHLYSFVWRFIGIRESGRICAAVTTASLVNVAVSILAGCRMPISVYVMAYTLSLASSGSIRFTFRFIRMYENINRQKRVDDSDIERIMVIGGGAAGRMLIKEYATSTFLHAKICCVIDDNPGIQGKYLLGVPVVGNRHGILAMAEKYKISTIVLAMPSASAKTRRDILAVCKNTSCTLRTVPGIYQLVNGEVSVSRLRKVSIEDLLGREQIQVNLDEIMAYVEEKTVLITGGGGSIGSELCRQIAIHKPKKLLILDIYENNAYDIEQELRRKYPKLPLTVLIGSVRDEKRVEEIFADYRPELVYHAAAHKHVPLMEDNPNEAIKNNVFGTFHVAKYADKYRVEKFVLISTDKAVNPTNIMGASKRICEMIVQSMNRTSQTDFAAVRFGNVLGSNGSVIPLFQKQIEAGGPVTVTHPDIIRYFMTIPEAVSLVLQAGAYAKGGEIFVLDMGEPMRIADLARNLIQLSGYKADEDIKIEYTGLRPGEKLYEELLMSEEGMQETKNQLIHIGRPIDIDTGRFASELQKLQKLCQENSVETRACVQRIVETYHEADVENVNQELQEKLDADKVLSVQAAMA